MIWFLCLGFIYSQVEIQEKVGYIYYIDTIVPDKKINPYSVQKSDVIFSERVIDSCDVNYLLKAGALLFIDWDNEDSINHKVMTKSLESKYNLICSLKVDSTYSVRIRRKRALVFFRRREITLEDYIVASSSSHRTTFLYQMNSHMRKDSLMDYWEPRAIINLE